MTMISVPDLHTTGQFLLRWLHLLAGITWIGLLYFFNLVNVPFAKTMDGETKKKVIPELMPRTLWWFRWGAVWTVVAGLLYFVDILRSEPASGRMLVGWLVLVGVGYAVMYLLLRPSTGLNGKAGSLSGLIAVVAVAFLLATMRLMDGASHRALSIGVGGGYGVFMLLNVWAIIWPNQKRIIAWTKDGQSSPEMPVLARQAFLASRTNAWLSIPMLFFMGAASHFPFFSSR